MECSRRLLEVQTAFDITNKRYLLESEISGGELILKNGQRVKRLVLPRIKWADKDLADFVNRANKGGVKILMPDGESIEGLDFTPEKMDSASLAGGEIALAENNPYILTMQKSYSDCDIFMLVNSAETKAKTTVKIADDGYNYATVDVDSYSTNVANPTVKDGYAHIDLSFSPLEAKFIMRYKEN